MDISTCLGLVAGAIVFCALIMVDGDLRMFTDLHAAIVIFGGSFSATLTRFPLSSIIHGLPSENIFMVAGKSDTDPLSRITPQCRRTAGSPLP